MRLDFPLVVVFSYILPGSIIWFVKGSSEKTRVKKMEILECECLLISEVIRCPKILVGMN